MKKYLWLVPLLLLSAQAWSCSCRRLASVDETIARSPMLVEARVIGFVDVSSPAFGRPLFIVTLEVVQSLKGDVASKTITVQQSKCYSSLYPDLMKLQHIYVLPLQPPIDGRYELAPCAHSGMELMDGKLYTFEPNGEQRRLQFYKNYSDFQPQ